VDGDVPYIAMELLNGESLGDRLDRVGRLSPAETARIMADVSRAVDYAHAAGVVHRDLKPDNIFWVLEGDNQIAKVLDFGIAKVTGNGLDATTGGGTRTGAMLGTPFYVSPEQARGNKRVDHRSDLWALGVITYQCLLGTLPFNSDGLGDLLMKICSDTYPPPSTILTVPPGFDEWVLRALSKEPEDRFQSAGDMFSAFHALAAGAALLDGSTPPQPFGQPTAQANTVSGTTSNSLGPIAGHVTTASSSLGSPVPLLLFAAMGVLAAIVVLGGGAWWLHTQSSARAATALEATPESPAEQPSSPDQVPAANLPEPPVLAEPPPSASVSQNADAELEREPSGKDTSVATPVRRTPRKASGPSRQAHPAPPPAPAPSPTPAKPRSTARSGADLFNDRR
jgi:serine/threonine-protein kinase